MVRTDVQLMLDKTQCVLGDGRGATPAQAPSPNLLRGVVARLGRALGRASEGEMNDELATADRPGADLLASGA